MKEKNTIKLEIFFAPDLGINVETGLYVNRIQPGSPAAREGSLALGDRVLAVNGHPTEGLTANDMMSLLGEAGQGITLQVIK